MSKVLMIASVASMIDKFNMQNIAILQKMGYGVDVAANFDFGSITSQERVDEFKQELIDSGISVHNIHIPRKISDIKGIVNSYKKIKMLCLENKYKIVHCHSPIGGVLTRLAAIKARKIYGTKVIYTAHGFHFYKGAPLLNWLIYFPLEWFCSFFTDALITINKEDYAFAKKHMHSKNMYYTHGIGVDVEKFYDVDFDKSKKRKEIDVPDDVILLMSVGEINKNKNHEIIVRSLEKLDDNIHYCIVGYGSHENYIKQLSKELGVDNRLHLLGYRNDIKELLHCADIFVFPSHREGLPVSLMEAMAAGLPVICSNIRGNSDLICDGQGGYLCESKYEIDFANKIKELTNDRESIIKFGAVNNEFVKLFSVNAVNEEMKKIYGEYL